jgi:glycosyltransferase involved in cell wall biosynthesis
VIDVILDCAADRILSADAHRMNSLVRVIIPNYNYGRFLRVSVGSVLAQEDVDLEILVIDDASTDDSQRIAAELASANRRIELRRHPENRGHVRTYNEGLQWAAGAAYGVVLDPDDALTPGSLRRAAGLLDAHPRVGFAYGTPKLFWGEGPLPRAKTGPGRWRIWSGQEWFAFRCRRAENCVFAPEIVLRMSVVEEAGGFREDLPRSGDFELWMRLSLYADVGYIAGPHAAYYRDHAGGMHHSLHATPYAMLTERKKAFDAVLRDHHADKIPDWQALQEMAGRGLARLALEAACTAHDRGPGYLEEADALERLAFAAYGRADELWAWRLLTLRKAMGPRASRFALPLRALSVAQYLSRGLKRRRLRASGL